MASTMLQHSREQTWELQLVQSTDVAIESFDIVLMKSDPADVATSIELSRATMTNIKENPFWGSVL